MIAAIADPLLATINKTVEDNSPEAKLRQSLEQQQFQQNQLRLSYLNTNPDAQAAIFGGKTFTTPVEQSTIDLNKAKTDEIKQQQNQQDTSRFFDPTASVNVTPASTFADQKDLDNFAAAKANGATDQEALKTGDNGIGAWGNSTVAGSGPQVALPPGRGVYHGRPIFIQGPGGSGVATIGDIGPAGRIDLNPDAAAMVGHPGGVVPVKWSFLSGATPPAPDVGAGQIDLAAATPSPIPAVSLDTPAAIPSVLAADVNTPSSGVMSTDTYAPTEPPPEPQQVVGQDEPQQSDSGNIIPSTLKLNPIPAGGKLVTVDAKGRRYFDNGVIADPKTGSLEWGDGHGNTFRYAGGQGVEIIKADKPPPTFPMQDPETGLVRRFTMENGQLKKVPVAGETEMTPPPEGVTGEDAIKDLSPTDQSYVKRFARGDLRTQTGVRANPVYARLREYVLAYDPDFKESLFDNIKTVTQQYNNPAITAPGGQIASVNTLLKQLPKFYDYAKALDNKDFQTYNQVGNFLNNVSGKPEVNNFLGMRDNIIREMARFLKGGVPDNADYVAAEKVLSAANSQEKLDGMIKGVIPDTILPKLSTLDYEYSQQTKGRKFPGLVTPEADAAMKKLGIENPIGKAQAPAANVTKQQAVERATQILSSIPASSTNPEDIAKRSQAEQALSIANNLPE